MGAKGRETAGDDHLKPFFGGYAQAADLAFPGGAGQHVLVVLDIVVKVPGAGAEDAAHLTLYANAPKFPLDHAFHRAGDFRDGEFRRVLAGGGIVDQIGHAAHLVTA